MDLDLKEHYSDCRTVTMKHETLSFLYLDSEFILLQQKTDAFSNVAKLIAL